MPRRWFTGYDGDGSWFPKRGMSRRFRDEISDLCRVYGLYQCDTTKYQGTDYFVIHDVPVTVDQQKVRRLVLATIREFCWKVVATKDDLEVKFEVTMGVYEPDASGQQGGLPVPGQLICDVGVTIKFPPGYPILKPLLVPSLHASWSKTSFTYLPGDTICAMTGAGWDGTRHNVCRAVEVFVAWIALHHAQSGDKFKTGRRR